MTPEELSFNRWKSEQHEINEVKEALQQADSGRLVIHSTVKRLFPCHCAADMASDFCEADSLAKLKWADVVLNHLRSTCDALNRSELPTEWYLSNVFSTVEMICKHPDIGRPGRVRGTKEWYREIFVPTVVYRERCGDIEVLGLRLSSRKWPYMKTAQV